MKKGFTFAELMISLVIISIIAIVLFPTVKKLAPNHTEQLYRAAYKTTALTLEDITSEGKRLNQLIGSDAQDTNADGIADNNLGTARALCEAFAERLNARPNPDTDCTGAAPLNAPTITTNNGIRWAFDRVQNGNPPTYTYYIYIDANPGNNDKLNNDCPTLESNARTAVFAQGCFKRSTLIDTFTLTIDSTGHINGNSGTNIIYNQ